MANGIPWRGQERRRSLRFPCELSVSCRPVEGDEPPADADSQDVSVDGLSVLSPVAYPVGAQIEVTFTSPADGAELHLVGVVRRSLPRDDGHHELGIEFSDTDWSARSHLLNMAPRQPWGADGWQNRTYVRVPCRLRVRYKDGLISRWHEATSRDLGVGGIMFESDEAIRPGTRMKVQIPLDGGTASVSGVVVEADGDGPAGHLICVAFIDPSDDARGLLAEFVTATCAKFAPQ